MATSAPPVTTVPLQDVGQALGSAAGGIRPIANAAANANVAGATTALGGVAQTLATGGALAMSPQVKAEYDSILKSVTTTIKPWTTKVTNANRTITTLTIDRDELQARVDAGETLSTSETRKLQALNDKIVSQQAIIDDLQPKIDAQNARVTTFMETNVADAPKITELISQEYPEFAAALAESEPFLQKMGELGYDGEVLQSALRQGYTAGQITYNNAQVVNAQTAQLGAAPTATAAQAQFVQGPQAAQAGFVQGPQAAQAQLSSVPVRDVTTSDIQAGQVGPQQQIQAKQIQAAQMGSVAPVKGPAGYTPQQVRAIQAQRVADIQAQQVGQGALGGQLMAEAQRRVALNGRLSPEATRDAIQSARQGFAARGMATGNAALAAELLNRDRYSRQRGLEDLQFAQGVQNSDLARQQGNMDAALRAAAANQSTAAGFSLADQSAGMSAQQLNQAANARAAEFLQSGQLQAGLANAQTAYNTGQTNAQLAQQAALAYADNDLRAQAANQGTTLSAGTTQAQLGTQAAIASAGNNLTAGQSNQAADINSFTQGNQMNQFNAGQANQLGVVGYQGTINQNQFNAGNQQQANLTGYQGGINQNQFNTGQTNQVGLANLGVASNYGLTQGQLAQGANNLNAQLGTSTNVTNASQNFAQSGAQADENYRGYGANIGALQGAYGLDQQVTQGGLGAAGIRLGLEQGANPNNMMMNWYGSAQPVGSQAMGPAANLTGQIYTNNANIGMFNANAQNWSQGTQWLMNNTPSYGGNNMLLGGLGGAMSGAATGFMVGGPYGAAIGGAAGLGLGLLGSR